MSEENLDFLDSYDADRASNPTEYQTPLYKRVFRGFFCGEAEVVKCELKELGSGDSASKFIEMYVQLPEGAGDSAGNDALQVKFGLPRAIKPAGITFAKMGVPVQDIKNGLIRSNPDTFGESIASKVLGTTVRVLQVPGAVKGRNGRRYDRQEFYTEAGWNAMVDQCGGVPSAEQFNIQVDGGTAAQGDDDIYGDV